MQKNLIVELQNCESTNAEREKKDLKIMEIQDLVKINKNGKYKIIRTHNL